MSSPGQPVTGLLLSGGVDSAVLLHQLLERGWRVVPFYVRTGCVWQSCELGAVRQFLAAVARPALADLVPLDLPVNDLYGNHWSISGAGAPDDATPDEAVYLPGRNPLLLIKPALWCQARGIEHLAIATLQNNPFADATPEFFTSFERMISQATGPRLHVARPFENLTKRRVMELGRGLPWELTFSCLAPTAGLHCGHCNKCAERRRAFRHLPGGDPTTYAAEYAIDAAR